MAAFDQAEHAFTFANPATPSNEGSDPHDIDHATVLGRGRGKIHFQGDRCGVDEPHCDQRAPKNGDMMLSGCLDQTARYREAARDNHARDMLSAQLETTGALFGLI